MKNKKTKRFTKTLTAVWLLLLLGMLFAMPQQAYAIRPIEGLTEKTIHLDLGTGHESGVDQSKLTEALTRNNFTDISIEGSTVTAKVWDDGTLTAGKVQMNLYSCFMESIPSKLQLQVWYIGQKTLAQYAARQEFYDERDDQTPLADGKTYYVLWGDRMEKTVEIELAAPLCGTVVTLEYEDPEHPECGYDASTVNVRPDAAIRNTNLTVQPGKYGSGLVWMASSSYRDYFIGTMEAGETYNAHIEFQADFPIRFNSLDPPAVTVNGEEVTSFGYAGIPDLQAVDVSIAAVHDLQEHPEVPATCHAEGVAGYWECRGCGKKFADAACTTEIDAPVVLPVDRNAHDWGKPVWTWGSDLSEAKAVFTCTQHKGYSYTAEAALKDGTIVTDASVKAKKHDDVKKPYTAAILGPDGREYMDTAEEVLKATHRIRKTKKAKDGKTVDLDVKTDVLEYSVNGLDISGKIPVLVPSYDKEGRFLGVDVLTRAAEPPAAADENAHSIKILWIDGDSFAPRTDAEEVERKE